jgi:hypothetical protein
LYRNRLALGVPDSGTVDRWSMGAAVEGSAVTAVS